MRQVQWSACHLFVPGRALSGGPRGICYAEQYASMAGRHFSRASPITDTPCPGRTCSKDKVKKTGNSRDRKRRRRLEPLVGLHIRWIRFVRADLAQIDMPCDGEDPCPVPFSAEGVVSTVEATHPDDTHDATKSLQLSESFFREPHRIHQREFVPFTQERHRSGHAHGPLHGPAHEEDILEDRSDRAAGQRAIVRQLGSLRRLDLALVVFFCRLCMPFGVGPPCCRARPSGPRDMAAWRLLPRVIGVMMIAAGIYYAANTYFYLSQQHRSAWTHEIDLRAFSDRPWWNH